jgi:hypothetical protein
VFAKIEEGSRPVMIKVAEAYYDRLDRPQTTLEARDAQARHHVIEVVWNATKMALKATIEPADRPSLLGNNRS